MYKKPEARSIMRASVSSTFSSESGSDFQTCIKTKTDLCFSVKPGNKDQKH